MAYEQKNNPFKKSPLRQETIKRWRKRHARSIRPKTGEYVKGQPEGSQSTHLMATYTGEGGKHYVAPTITNKTKSGKYENQSFNQALSAGEVYEFKSKRRAEKFAAGSWKKGKDRKEAMKTYRKNKRKNK